MPIDGYSNGMGIRPQKLAIKVETNPIKYFIGHPIQLHKGQGIPC